MAARNETPVHQLTSAGNEFGLDLYQSLSTDASANLFFSPVSIFTALAMTYIGARGNTAVQMKSTLKFDKLDESKLHPTFEELTKVLFQSSKSYQLHGANRLYIQRNYGLIDEFLQTVKKHYQAGLESVDFISATEQARNDINSWVENQTKDKIKDLLPPQSINSLTRLVLVNAIYFKGNWVKQFNKEATSDLRFQVSKDEAYPVRMMTMESSFPYLRDESLKFHVLEMPYVENHLSMVIALPFDKDGLAEFENQLSSELLQKILGQKPSTKVKVYLPRFKVEESFLLNSQLVSLGMSDLFDLDKCDLSGVSVEGDLVVSKVIHKAFVEVNEEGSEAAAATAVVMMKRSMAVSKPKPTFRADHPFLFFIQDNRSKAVLFMGRVVRPPKSPNDEL